jgi:hypothetical protein
VLRGHITRVQAQLGKNEFGQRGLAELMSNTGQDCGVTSES